MTSSQISATGEGAPRAPRAALPTQLVKVPVITAVFWLAKLLTTGLGESASDWLLNRGEGLPGLGIGGALAIDAGLFVAAFAIQLSVRRYVPAAYWFAVIAVAIVGTVVADITHFVLGVPLWATTGVPILVLSIIFTRWHRSEGTVSIHSIVKGRRETYYWLTVFFTFALGTALGDLTASVGSIGFLGSILLFAALMVIPAVGHARFGMNAVVAFWIAYVLTRPLGASVADWLAVPGNEGGLDFGAGPVTWVATALIVALVVSLTVAHRRMSRSLARG